MSDFEPEVADAGRAFPESQALLPSVASERLPGTTLVGWYDVSVEPTVGAFAVVKNGGDLDALIGETIKVTVGDRFVLAYVLGAREIPDPLALYRRAFLAVAGLYQEYVDAVIEVTE